MYKKASVNTALQNCSGKKNTPWQTKPYQKLMEYKMCLANCIVIIPHLGKVCVFCTNTVKVGTVWLTHCCVIISSGGWYHYIYVYILVMFSWNTAYTLKKALKIGAPKFWPSHHYSCVVQTASNWNLQKLLKSEL